MEAVIQVEVCWENPPRSLLYRPHSLVKHISLLMAGFTSANYKPIILCPDCAYPISIIDEVTPSLVDGKRYTIIRDRVITCLWCYFIERLHEMWGRSYIIDKNVTTHTNHLIYDEEAELYYIKQKNIKKKNKKL